MKYGFFLPYFWKIKELRVKSLVEKSWFSCFNLVAFPNSKRNNGHLWLGKIHELLGHLSLSTVWILAFVVNQGYRVTECKLLEKSCLKFLCCALIEEHEQVFRWNQCPFGGCLNDLNHCVNALITLNEVEAKIFNLLKDLSRAKIRIVLHFLNNLVIINDSNLSIVAQIDGLCHVSNEVKII